MTVLVGASVALSWSPGGAGTATLVVLLPDGTTLTPALTVTGTAGVYTATLPTTQAGRHTLSWALGAVRHADVVDVWPADPHYLISVADALEAVKAGGTVPATTTDALPLYIAAATYVIEDICGPLIRVARTMKFDGGRSAIVLPAAPVTVTSVTVDGVLLAASAYVVDEAAGVIYYAFPATARQNVSVVFTQGSATLPANLRLACMEQVRFLWQTTRVGTGRGAQDLGYTPSGYAVPYMVQGLCATQAAAPGFA